MNYNYKRYNHRSKSLKSANSYLSKFFDNLELDYDDEAVYGATVKNLLGIKKLCLKIADRIDIIVSQNSKELNEVRYTYLSVINSAGSFKYLTYQAVVDVSKKIDSLVNPIITDPKFNYSVAEQLPILILKLIFLCSVKSADYEYVNYVHTLNISAVDFNALIGKIDFSQTVMYALSLYGMLWEHKLKPMSKYHGKYYLSPDSMYEFISKFGGTEELLNYYVENKSDNTFIEQVGIK
jgi:hypothetical protein